MNAAMFNAYPIYCNRLIMILTYCKKKDSP